MISAYAKTSPKNESFDPNVKKIQSICDMHNVPFGAPDALPGFMHKLTEDKHFAMDFWELIGRLRKEGVQLSDKRLLALIVESVTGRDVQYAEGVSKKLVDDLSRLLAGVEPDGPKGQGDVKTAVLPSAFPPGTGSQGFAEHVKRATAKESPATGPTPHPLGEALSQQLERENLLLNKHPNDLDNKVSKIEPHVEELTSTVSSAPSPAAKEEVRERVAEPVRKPVEEPVLRPLGSYRSVTEPRRASFARYDEEDDPSIPIPLAGYSQGGGHGKIALFAVLLLAIVGGLFTEQRYGSSSWQTYSAALRERYSSLKDKMHGAGSEQIAVNSTNQNASQSAAAGSAPGSAAVPAPGPDPSSAIPNESSSSPNPPSPDASAPSAPVAESSSASEQPPTKQAAASDRPQASGSESNPRSRRKAMSSDAVTASAAKAAPSDVDVADAINVAPGVMAANLVSSRVPAYPEAAKADRIEGSVVMRAVISKDGTVTRVDVLEGPRRLRSSALEAVRTWRYRPHLLNGRPVAVATTITVDFSLDN